MAWPQGERNYWRGRHLSEAHKRKISKANKGHPSSRKGVTVSEETKQKMREARLKSNHCFKKGQEPWNKGTHGVVKANSGSFKPGVSPIMSEETKRKIGDANRGQRRSPEQLEAMRGENSHCWKGGISTENQILRHSRENKDWREAVFERDNYTCQRCGQRGKTLNAHHLVPFASEYGKELRFAISNGWTVCETCHALFHSCLPSGVR